MTPPAGPGLRTEVDAPVRVALLAPQDVLAVRDDALLAADLASAFANPVRGQILMFVAQFTGPTVGDLSTLTGTSISLMSLYVSQLRDAGWVYMESIGRKRRVRMASEHRSQIVELVCHHARQLK